jgi:molecular chaperone GrpE
MKQAKKVTQEDKHIKPEENAETKDLAGKPDGQDTTEKESSQTEESELELTRKNLTELQDKYNQLNDTYLRTLAEFDNYRKRSVKEKGELIKNGGEKVLVEFLSVVDDMERGLTATKDAQDVEAIKEGMMLIYNKMQAFLKKNGVLTIETEGKNFDTDHHEAITTFPAPSEDLKGKVVDCVQKGYLLNEKVIRFAKVVVGE